MLTPWQTLGMFGLGSRKITGLEVVSAYDVTVSYCVGHKWLKGNRVASIHIGLVPVFVLRWRGQDPVAILRRVYADLAKLKAMGFSHVILTGPWQKRVSQKKPLVETCWNSLLISVPFTLVVVAGAILLFIFQVLTLRLLFAQGRAEMFKCLEFGTRSLFGFLRQSVFAL